MKGVEIAVHVKRLRQTLRSLLLLAVLGAAGILALRVPAVRVHAERVVDRLAAVFVPTPPAMTVTVLMPTPTPTATPTWTPRPRSTPTSRPALTPTPTPTPGPTPTPPPTPEPEVVGTPEVKIRVYRQKVVVEVVVPPVRYVRNILSRENEWYSQVVLIPDPVDLESIEFIAMAPPYVNNPDIDLRTSNDYTIQETFQDGHYLLSITVGDVSLESMVPYTISFRAYTESGREILSQTVVEVDSHEHQK